MNIFDDLILENSIQSWLIAIGLSLGIFLVLLVLRRLIQRRLERTYKRTNTELDDYLSHLVSQTQWFSLMAVGLLFGSLVVTLPETSQTWFTLILRLILTLQIGVWGTAVISLYVSRGVASRIDEDQGDDATTLDALGLIGKIILWVVLVLIILDNLNVEINSLVTSLGIGGIAVALAVQNILGDLFASLSITFDKPFAIGDFVVIDDYEGDVEDIGLKSTRIRSLSGEELIFSNTDLLASRIRNYKRMEKRRISFSVGVVYGTPAEKLKMIPGMLEEIITPHPDVQFERAHLKDLSDFSLEYSVVYYVLRSEYAAYLDIQQAINLEIYQRFEQEGIEFAYPTQTVILEGEGQ